MSHGQDDSGALNRESDDLIPTPGTSGPIELVNKGPLPNAQWKQSSRVVEEGLTQGLSNEDLWMLIRRFDKVCGLRALKNHLLTCEKQIYHVRAVQDTKAQSLDLNRVDNERFPPEKLRITIERFYTSVVVGVVEFFRHMTRLRSWENPNRTFVFCLVCSFTRAMCTRRY